MARRPVGPAQGGGTDGDDGIVAAALALAEEVGWDNVRLHEVAERAAVPVAEVRRRFRDADAIADAWLAHADMAMLAPYDAGFAARPARERLYESLCRWLDALAPHRRVTAEMLRTKLWPFHPHHYVPLVFWLSRTVQWWREAALLDAPAPQRQVEEIGLTWIFVATVAYWGCDRSPGQERSKAFLRRRLEQADWLMVRTFAPPVRRAARPGRRPSPRTRAGDAG
ncbi:MAG TPA: hypothetical protein VF274_07940 [Alphaproteobacteria bacterium]